MTRAWDVIALGSEPDALAAATYLARAGRRVLVLEPRELLGGSMVTQELVPGCRVDAVFDDLGWVAPAVVAELDLARHGLELLHPDPMLTAPARHGGHLALWRDIERTRTSIRSLSTRDAERWPEFVMVMAKHAALLETICTSPAPRPTSPGTDDLRSVVRLAQQVGFGGRADLLEFVRTLPMSIGELLDDWFESDTLKGALAAGGISGLMQGPRSGGTAFLFLHRHVGGAPGAVRRRQVARGGTGCLVDALAAAARAAGVQLRCGAGVERILTRDARVQGVVLANGDELTAPRVLSGADARTTLLELSDPLALDPEVVHAVRHIRHRGQLARVHLAVDELPRVRGLNGDGLAAGAVVIAPSIADLERAWDDAKYGRVSARPWLEVSIPTIADPTRAPDATHLLSVSVQYVPHTLREGEWTSERRDALGNLVVDLLAEYAPGLRDSIIERRVLAPCDLESCYGLREGAPDQGEMTLDQILFMRPLPGWAHYRTPIEGLWMCGAATHPGGRMPGTSGRLAAREMLRDRT